MEYRQFAERVEKLNHTEPTSVAAAIVTAANVTTTAQPSSTTAYSLDHILTQATTNATKQLAEFVNSSAIRDVSAATRTMLMSTMPPSTENMFPIGVATTVASALAGNSSQAVASSLISDTHHCEGNDGLQALKLSSSVSFVSI